MLSASFSADAVFGLANAVGDGAVTIRPPRRSGTGDRAQARLIKQKIIEKEQELEEEEALLQLQVSLQLLIIRLFLMSWWCTQGRPFWPAGVFLGERQDRVFQPRWPFMGHPLCTAASATMGTLVFCLQCAQLASTYLFQHAEQVVQQRRSPQSRDDVHARRPLPSRLLAPILNSPSMETPTPFSSPRARHDDGDDDDWPWAAWVVQKATAFAWSWPLRV